MSTSQIKRQGAHTNTFRKVGHDIENNPADRAIPQTSGLNSAKKRDAYNRDSHRTQEIPAMSHTQRIPNTNHRRHESNPQRGGASPYLYGATAEHPAVRKTPPSTKSRIFSFIEKYSTALAALCACILFFAISVPIVIFALSSPEEIASENSEAVYELNAETPGHDGGNAPGGEPDGELPSVGDTSDGSDEENTSPDETPHKTPDETPDETPNEDSSDSETGENSEPESTEAETEDPNAGKFPVTTYFYDREAITCYTEPATLRQILAREGCVLKNSDRPTVNLDDVIEYESWIMIDSVTYKQVTESEAIPFETVTYERHGKNSLMGCQRIKGKGLHRGIR